MSTGDGKCRMRSAGLALLLGFAGVSGPPASAQEVIGGIVPSERPAKAPKISQIQHGQDWYRRATTGVSQPYPKSLLFLDNQGDWYTPFNRPGAQGPYDLRRWYGSSR